MEAQLPLLLSLAEEGLIFLFWVVALVLMIVVFQEWQEDCSVVHPHLMMYKEREKQVLLEMVVGLGSRDLDPLMILMKMDTWVASHLYPLMSLEFG